jgi:hypothetical protein
VRDVNMKNISCSTIKLQNEKVSIVEFEISVRMSLTNLELFRILANEMLTERERQEWAFEIRNPNISREVYDQASDEVIRCILNGAKCDEMYNKFWGMLFSRAFPPTQLHFAHQSLIREVSERIRVRVSTHAFAFRFHCLRIPRAQ